MEYFKFQENGIKMLKNQLKQRNQGYTVGILFYLQKMRQNSEFYLLGVSGRFENPNVATETFVTQGVMTADPLWSRDAPEWLVCRRDLSTALYNTVYFSVYFIPTNTIHCSEFLRSQTAENQAMQKLLAQVLQTAETSQYQ